MLKYEKRISSNCKFFSHRICTAKSKLDRSLNYWVAIVIILLNIRCLSGFGVSLLLSDAEAREDGGEDVGSGDVAGDGGEVVDGLADVLGDEIGGKGGLEAVDYAAE